MSITQLAHFCKLYNIETCKPVEAILERLIEMFCKNNIYYENLQVLDPRARKHLLQYAEKAHQKYPSGSAFRRKAQVIHTVLSDAPKTAEFFLDVFTQPFGAQSRAQIVKFTRDTRALHDIIENVKQYTLPKHEQVFKNVCQKILGSNHGTCIATRWLFTFDIDSIKQEFPTFPDVSVKIRDIEPNWQGEYTHFTVPFGFLPIVMSEMPDNTPEHRPNLYKLLQAGMTTYTLNNPIKMRECIHTAMANKSFIFYETNIIIEPIPSLMIFNPSMHRSLFILNFKNYARTKKIDLYYLESSIAEQDSKWVYAEKIILNSVVFDLENNFDLIINIVTFDMDSCPRINIQGIGGTCALWTNFLFYIYALNQDRAIMFKTLQAMNQRERNKALLYFLCFVKIELSSRHSLPHPEIMAAVTYLQENSF